MRSSFAASRSRPRPDGRGSRRPCAACRLFDRLIWTRVVSSDFSCARQGVIVRVAGIAAVPIGMWPMSILSRPGRARQAGRPGGTVMSDFGVTDTRPASRADVSRRWMKLHQATPAADAKSIAFLQMSRSGSGRRPGLRSSGKPCVRACRSRSNADDRSSVRRAQQSVGAAASVGSSARAFATDVSRLFQGSPSAP